LLDCYLDENNHFRPLALRCFFHPDRPPVIFKVEIGKVVEKADVET